MRFIYFSLELAIKKSYSASVHTDWEGPVKEYDDRRKEKHLRKSAKDYQEWDIGLRRSKGSKTEWVNCGEENPKGRERQKYKNDISSTRERITYMGQNFNRSRSWASGVFVHARQRKGRGLPEIKWVLTYDRL